MSEIKKPVKNYSEILAKRKFDPSAPVEQDKIYLSVKNSILGTAGNFISFTGLPKAGKSNFISAIIASAISKREIFNFKTTLYQDKPNIALFDTEQGNYDFQRMMKKIKTLADQEKIYDRFQAYQLREDDSFDILRLIGTYLKENEDTGIIIIDGLLDCIDNMNDEGASKRLIRVLKRWAIRRGILIVTVLHVGKKDKESIGHIGSAVDRYAQSVLTIEKTKSGTYTCKPKFLRSAKDFDTIEIFFDEVSNNYSLI